MKNLDKAHSGITRVEVPDRRLLGWIVSLSHEGKAVRRYFSDRKYGGREAAYQAAKGLTDQWGDRAEVLALLRRLKPRKNTRSGIPGVARYEGQHRRGPHWMAYWSEGSHRVKKRFSVSLHGEDTAREMAIVAREKAVNYYAELLEQIRQRDDCVLSLLPNTKGLEGVAGLALQIEGKDVEDQGWLQSGAASSVGMPNKP